MGNGSMVDIPSFQLRIHQLLFLLFNTNQFDSPALGVAAVEVIRVVRLALELDVSLLDD